MADEESKMQRLAHVKAIVQQGIRRRRMLSQRILMYNAYRRRRLTVLLCLVGLLLLSRHQNNATERVYPRSCRRLIRNCGWWDLVWNSYSDERFKKTFRVSKNTFNFILSRIRHDLERETVNEDPISPECRLGICLYRLGRGDYYYTIAEMAGLGVSTVHSIVTQVCASIVENLWQECITEHMPESEDDFNRKMEDMNNRWQFPFCWAAIDGCHIPIKCPPGGAEACKEYHNFKNFYSIVLMAMVDSRYRFIWGSCGFPGNSHDAVIFQSTGLWENIKKHGFIPDIGQQVADVTVPPLIIGDSAFPFQPWLLKPYTNAVLTAKQRYFNYRLSRARMITEGAYGQLKGRWRVLLRRNESGPHEAKTATLTCMVLHNICIEKGDTISRNLDLTIDPQTNERKPRQAIRDQLHMTACNKVVDTCIQAGRIRDTLTDKLWGERNL